MTYRVCVEVITNVTINNLTQVSTCGKQELNNGSKKDNDTAVESLALEAAEPTLLLCQEPVGIYHFGEVGQT